MTSTGLLEMRAGHPGAEARGSLYRKLKPGPGRAAEEVIANQLARLRGAMVELVAERGIGGVTVRGLSSTAGVSTRTFYKHFPNAEECFTSTYESVMRVALHSFTASKEMTNDDWEAAVREGLRSLMAELAEHPGAGMLALVESFEAGPAMLREMSSATREFERSVIETFKQAPERIPIPLPIVQGIAAGVERVLRARVIDGEIDDLPEISGELAGWALSMHDPIVARMRGPGQSGQGRERRTGARVNERELSAIELDPADAERGSILAATAKLAIRDGYWNLTIPKIRKQAAISRRTFDEHFSDVDDAYLGAIEALGERAAVRAERKAIGAETWERGICRMVSAYCIEVARTPALSRLAFIDVFAPGRAGLKCRERRIGLAAERLRRIAAPWRELSPLAAEASAGACWRIIQAEIAAGRERTLPQVAPQLAFVTLTPAVGAPAAARAIAWELRCGPSNTLNRVTEGNRKHPVWGT